MKSPEENWDINVNGTLNLLEACRRNGIGNFVFASSNAVVGEQAPPIDESKIAQPLSPYGASKLAAEALCSAYYYSFGLNTICLRFANCYGPYAEHNPGVVTRFMDWARQGKPLVIYGDGKQTRDFIHADDICQAVHLALRALEAGLKTADLRLFQIGTGIETSINELAWLIEQTTAKYRLATDSYRLPIIHKPKRRGEIRRDYSDITRAKRVLQFEPKITLREGLERLCGQTWLSTND